MNEFIKKYQTHFYIATTCVVALIALFSIILWRNTRFPSTAPIEPGSSEESTDTQTELLRRKLDGSVITDVTEADQHPVAIMIENASDAWPLSGLDKAQVVYETLAEGWIPRFLAIFATTEHIESIGPVRSSRSYFIDWAEPYRAAFMHVGGSPDSLQTLRTTNRVINIDQFFKSQYFWRSQKRYAPHNVYTSSTLLKKMALDNNLGSESDYHMLTYADSEPLLIDRPTEVKDIVVNFTTRTYQARWKYDRDQNAYTRYQQNSLFLMEDGAPISAKNVIVQVTDMRIIDAVGRRDIRTIGEGKAVIFRDGIAITGMWRRESTADVTRYYDAQGDEITLNGGATWIAVIPNENMLEY